MQHSSRGERRPLRCVRSPIVPPVSAPPPTKAAENRFGSVLEPSIGRQMHDVMRRLFPLCRSITGDGVRQTLRILQELIPLRMMEVPSGTQVFDWTVPNEWNIRDAFVKDASGRRVIDFRRNNLHVVGYSVPFSGKMPLSELKAHLHTNPAEPDAIPYVTSYYAPRWGFCLPHNELQRLPDGIYDVGIDSTLGPGSLTYGELLIPGRSDREIFISTYVCHPSLANNELSGPVIAAQLARRLLARGPGEYGYRFVFVPETIGSITYLSRHLEHLRRSVAAAYLITCVGDEGGFSYMPSRKGDALVDRLTPHVFKHAGLPLKVYDFLTCGSDERQYCSPGVDLPLGALMRSKYGAYRQYHTSADDLSFVTPEGLRGSLEMYERCLGAIELNRVYTRTTLCDPQLGRRGLYPTLSTRDSAGAAVMDMVNLLAFACDGNDLLAVAERLGKPIESLAPIARSLAAAGLLDERLP